jgi:Flp pilus assembly protein CpaB
VTAEASRDRLALASQAGSLSLALDAADTIQAQDALEKMLVHQMAVLHYGMMRATAKMNKEFDGGRGRHGNEQDQGTAEERRRGMIEK